MATKKAVTYKHSLQDAIWKDSITSYSTYALFLYL